MDRQYVWTDERERLRVAASMLEHIAVLLSTDNNATIEGFSERIKKLSFEMNSYDAKCRSYQLSPADVERYLERGIEGL